MVLTARSLTALVSTGMASLLLWVAIWRRTRALSRSAAAVKPYSSGALKAAKARPAPSAPTPASLAASLSLLSAVPTRCAIDSSPTRFEVMLLKAPVALLLPTILTAIVTTPMVVPSLWGFRVIPGGLFPAHLGLMPIDLIVITDAFFLLEVIADVAVQPSW